MLVPNIGDLEVKRGSRVPAVPRVSVVIPAFRPRPEQPDYLEEALESVRSQSYDNVRSSSSMTARRSIAPARTDDLVIVRQPNTGPGGARNVGSVIAHAR